MTPPLTTTIGLVGLGLIVLDILGRAELPTIKLVIPPERQMLTGGVGTLLVVIAVVIYVASPLFVVGDHKGQATPTVPIALAPTPTATLTPCPTGGKTPEEVMYIQPTSAHPPSLIHPLDHQDTN